MDVPLFLGSVLLAGALTCAGCAKTGNTVAAQDQLHGGGGAPQQAAVPVTVGTVEQKPVPLDIRVIGAAQAYAVVAVHAEIMGELTSVNFREGDDIQKGQVIFTLDQRPLQAALQQAQANLEHDAAQTAYAHLNAKRYQDLMTVGIATKDQTDVATTAATALEATLNADRAAIESAKVQLQYATIRAPISGRTGALMVAAGNLVRANDTTPLVVISQVSPIYVSFGIPEARLADLRHYLGQGSVRVEASPPEASGPPSIGRISFVDSGVDPTTGTITLKGEFPNQDRRLWPGQFVNVIVTLTTAPNAIVVPTVAVQNGQLGDYVFVVTADHIARFRKVTLERTVGKDVVIREGLKPGETVVTDGQLRLNDGSRVTLKTGLETTTGATM